MKNAGTILEPACLYADQGNRKLMALAAVVTGDHCRNAVIHLSDINFLGTLLDVSRIAVVVDFPYGRSGNCVLAETIFKAADFGIRNLDVCVNLAEVIADDFEAVCTRFRVVQNTLNEAHVANSEIKAIIQLPYLWQYVPGRIAPLICVLAKAGVSVIKDWTTVHNFSKPVDVSLAARLNSLDYVKQEIYSNHLPLKVKIAGGVRPDNAVEFVKHGADILGVDVQYVPDVIRALESAS